MKNATPSGDLYAYSKLLFHALGVALGAGYMFIDKHIWTPAEAYILVMSLVMFDFVTGVLYALRTRTYTHDKAKGVIFTMGAYTALLFYSFQFSKLGGVWPMLTHIVFVPMVLVTLISLVKNFLKLGWIKKEFADQINSKIHSNLKSNETNFSSDSAPVVE